MQDRTGSGRTKQELEAGADHGVAGLVGRLVCAAEETGRQVQGLLLAGSDNQVVRTAVAHPSSTCSVSVTLKGCRVFRPWLEK